MIYSASKYIVHCKFACVFVILNYALQCLTTCTVFSFNVHPLDQHKYPKRPPRKQNEGSYRRNIPGNRRGNIDQSAPYHSRSQEPFRDSPGKGSRYQDREDSFLDREPHFQDREASFQDSGPRYQDREGSFQDRGPGNTGMGRGNWLSNNREKSSNVGKMKGVKFMQQPVRPPGGRGVPRHKTTQHQPPQQVRPIMSQATRTYQYFLSSSYMLHATF